MTRGAHLCARHHHSTLSGARTRPHAAAHAIGKHSSQTAPPSQAPAAPAAARDATSQPSQPAAPQHPALGIPSALAEDEYETVYTTETVTEYEDDVRPASKDKATAQKKAAPQTAAQEQSATSVATQHSAATSKGDANTSSGAATEVCVCMTAWAQRERCTHRRGVCV